MKEDKDLARIAHALALAAGWTEREWFACNHLTVSAPIWQEARRSLSGLAANVGIRGVCPSHGRFDTVCSGCAFGIAQ